MKEILKELMTQALLELNQLDQLGQVDIVADVKNHIRIDYIKDIQHGDFSCHIALLLAKKTGHSASDLANEIIARLPFHPDIKKIQVGGAGFINFFVFPRAFRSVISAIADKKTYYGHSTILQHQKIHIEFVSANPTGPLHVGHGRSAAYGATLANLFSAMGASVHKEYYVNDAGRQMDILTLSTYLRYLEQMGEYIAFPANAYQGDYLINIAKNLLSTDGKKYAYAVNAMQSSLVAEPTQHPDVYIDSLIACLKKQLIKADYQAIFMHSLTAILTDIQQDLSEFGVAYDTWFSERKMQQEGLLKQAIDLLEQKNLLYQQDNAIWFKSTAFGDDKDRVVIRENGEYTYFASDIAYHQHKFQHYDQVINILGADHHGYIPRLKAIIRALGHAVNNFHTPLIQFAVLYRGKQRVAMSTRSGEFVTLRTLREEIGKDAARFFYIMRRADQQMDFDLSLAKACTNENPVYYVQYAHARIASVFRQLAEKKLSFSFSVGLNNIDALKTDTERSLLLTLDYYQEMLQLATLRHEPHLVANYLKTLSEDFHAYYNSCAFLITDNDNIRHARLCLITVIQQILANGLKLLGVRALESM